MAIFEEKQATFKRPFNQTYNAVEEPEEASFIPHCDDELCDFGKFQYVCPTCGELSTDYEIWWLKDRIFKGSKIRFKCSKCKQPLLVSWDKDMQYYALEIAKNNIFKKMLYPILYRILKNDMVNKMKSRHYGGQFIDQVTEIFGIPTNFMGKYQK